MENCDNVCDQIGLASEDGFPLEAYCFTDGQLSVQMERNGGLNELRYISILEENNTFYPERYCLPVLSKSNVRNYSYGLYGPVMRFLSTLSGGRNMYHVPDNVRFLPFGFTSSSDRFGVHAEYDMCMKGRSIVFSFRNSAKNRESLDMMFYAPGMARGEFPSWIVPQGEEIEYPPERKAIIRWNELKFDKQNNCLYATGQVFRYLSPGEKICIAIAAGGPAEISQSEYDHKILSMKWGKSEELNFFLTFNATYEECLQNIGELKKDPAGPWVEQTRHYANLARKIPIVKIDGHESSSEMARTIPLFVNAMKLNETEKMVTNRAATHKFGYYPHWDVQWTNRAALLWGDYGFVKKVVRHALTQMYLLDDRGACEIFLLAAEYYSLTRDKEFISQIYKQMHSRFNAVLDSCGENGLLPYGQYGADDYHQLKIPGSRYYAPDCSGWAFGCIRAMENLAMLMGDEETAGKSRRITETARKSYLDTFYNKELGYLHCAVGENGEKLDVYQNVATLAMESPYGDILLDGVMENLAAFQRDHLYHPSGRSAVPYWCKADEMWKSCIMLQHAHHEMRTLRFAGETGDLMRMWNVYLKLFETCKLQIETINLCGMPGDPTGQRSDWQAFGSSAQYMILFRAIIGIEADYRGITYVPCNLPLQIGVENFSHGNTQWKINISGSGAWVKSFKIDGKELCGSLKAPSCCFSEGEHVMEIERGPNPPQTTCILRAVGAGVTVESADSKRLVAELDGCGRIPVRFYAPSLPKACLIDGKESAFEWNAGKNTGLVEIIVRKTATLEIIS